jgi:hypothetical protein
VAVGGAGVETGARDGAGVWVVTEVTVVSGQDG